MRTIAYFTYVLALLAAAASTSAYPDNCDGSFFSPKVEDCNKALTTIDRYAAYEDGREFSVGTCYLVYKTDGAGPQAIIGETIYNTARFILDNCQRRRGSKGTENCDSCHVTVNYRTPRTADR